jgi:hypothetical protein
MTKTITEGVLVSRWAPLSEAALCLDEACETVFSVRDRACPLCGSENFEMLATWLSARRPHVDRPPVTPRAP